MVDTDAAVEEAVYHRNLIRDFRISQLQALLVFSGQNRSGRKEALLDRALQLADLGSKTINLKIREIAHLPNRREVGSSANNSENTGQSVSSMSCYSNPYTSPIPDSPPTSPTRPPPPAHRSSLPKHPDVTLKSLPFFDVWDTLVKPSSLQSSSNARLQEQVFQFHLTPSQATQITQSSVRNEFKRPEYRVQIQMRFSLLETSCAQEDCFPSSVSVKVNGKMCPLPPILSTTKPGVEPRRPPQPVNITGLCKLTATSANSVQVTWAVESGKMFTVSFYLVEELTFQDLLNRLKEKGEKHPEFTKALIKSKLGDVDSEISTTNCKVSLACPLGKMRIRNPCRSVLCDHLQTFDAELFLQMNQKKPTWTCPVCNKSAVYENLVIDGFFNQLLGSDRLPSDEHEIVLKEDGSWEPLPPKQEEVENIAATINQSDFVPISDSDSESNSKPVNETSGGDVTKSTAMKRRFSENEVITLDSDSDSEDKSDVKKSRLCDQPNQPGSPDSDIIILDDD